MSRPVPFCAACTVSLPACRSGCRSDDKLGSPRNAAHLLDRRNLTFFRDMYGVAESSPLNSFGKRRAGNPDGSVRRPLGLCKWGTLHQRRGFYRMHELAFSGRLLDPPAQQFFLCNPVDPVTGVGTVDRCGRRSVSVPGQHFRRTFAPPFVPAGPSARPRCAFAAPWL